ncbi:hypothetical protein Tco_0491137 [Tanacetum coccineum]
MLQLVVFSSIKHQIKLISFSKTKSYSSSTGLKTKSSLKKIVYFAAEGSSNSDTDKIMARTDAMTMKIDAQYKDFQSRSKQSNLDDDDIPMSHEEEAKFMQTFRRRDVYQFMNAILRQFLFDWVAEMEPDKIVTQLEYTHLTFLGRGRRKWRQSEPHGQHRSKQNGDDSNSGDGCLEGIEHAARECTYPDF